MKYQDKKYGFSFEVPNDWGRQGRFFRFIITGGKVAFESPEKEASVNVSAGVLDKKEWTDKLTRKRAMSDFLRTAPPTFGMSDYIEQVENFVLDGERNIVYYRHGGSNGHGRIISSVHDGMEYVIQSKDSKRYETTIDGIIQSFKFGK